MSELLSLTDINKTYNKKQVLKGINLVLEKGELFSLVGPSGTGKTTLLKIITGLEVPDNGNLTFYDNCNHKDTILVFQEYLLFPHMTIRQNLMFGLKARKLLDKKERKLKTDKYLSYFGLSDKANSYPEHLSGGQRQRVAIARAMILEPRLLLFDEPFANLDKNLKGETAAFIRKTVKDFGITAIVVTHDLEEASIISDKIGIMLEGSLRQTGTVSELYHDPEDLDIASFLGPVNHIPESILPHITTKEKIETGKDIYSRAQCMELKKDTEGKTVIESIEHRGTFTSLTAVTEGEKIIIHSFNNGFKVGDKVKIKLNSYFTNGG